VSEQELIYKFIATEYGYTKDNPNFYGFISCNQKELGKLFGEDKIESLLMSISAEEVQTYWKSISRFEEETTSD